MAVINTVYPNGIPIFPTHKNLLDDVDAHHINALQNEVTSVADILGENPQISNDVAVATQYIMAAPSGSGTLLDTVPPVGTGTLSTTAVDHGTVRDRLSAIEHSENLHWAQISTSGLQLPKAPTSVENTLATLNPVLRAVQFPNQGAAMDPYGMYDGVGLTCRKTGWWQFEATTILLRGGGAGFTGYYTSVLSIAGIAPLIQSIDTEYFNTLSGAAVGSVRVFRNSWQGPLFRGSPIVLTIGHNATNTCSIYLTTLTALLIREFGPNSPGPYNGAV